MNYCANRVYRFLENLKIAQRVEKTKAASNTASHIWKYNGIIIYKFKLSLPI